MILEWMLFSSFCINVRSVSIVTLVTPVAHEAGQELILDCDFDFEESEATQLDLKWYFNGSPIPIYQWVPALDFGPQVIHQMFRDNLDLKYQATSDKFKKHRALHILNPDERFSGNYRCKVSSFVDEDSDENDVIVYVPPSQATLNPVKSTDTDLVNISCHAWGIFPVPVMSLIWTENSTVLSSEDLVIDPNPDNPGLFDVSVTASIDTSDVVRQDMISCEITIPGTDFDMRMESEIFEKFDSTQEPDIQIEVFSGSASGSEEDELCDSSGDADCGSGYPMDYEVVDENCSKVGADIGTSEETARFESSSSGHYSMNPVLVLLFTFLIWGFSS